MPALFTLALLGLLPAEPAVIPAAGSSQLAPLHLAECGGVEVADWRSPEPLVVLADQHDDDSVTGILTSFALYRDGTLLRRRFLGKHIVVTRSRLTASEVERFVRSVNLPRLHGLAGAYTAAPYPPGYQVAAHATRSLLHYWEQGCHRRVVVAELQGWDLDYALARPGGRPGPFKEEAVARVRRALASLPPDLAAALATIGRFSAARGRELCRDESCFTRDFSLPNQSAWLDETTLPRLDSLRLRLGRRGQGDRTP